MPPVKTLSPTLYLDLACEPGMALPIPDAAPERALYSVDAPFELDGQAVPPFTMAVLAPVFVVQLARPESPKTVPWTRWVMLAAAVCALLLCTACVAYAL